MRVVLPAPLGPSKPKTEEEGISKEIPSLALYLSNCLTMFCSANKEINFSEGKKETIIASLKKRSFFRLHEVSVSNDKRIF
jgi:hypothetical protein